MKSVRIWSYSGPCFPAFGLNTDQNNSEYGHFLRSDAYNFLGLRLFALDKCTIIFSHLNGIFHTNHFQDLSIEKLILICSLYPNPQIKRLQQDQTPVNAHLF